MSDGLFELARFNVVCAALTPGPAERLDDAYVYAWSRGIFPLFHEGWDLHKPFAARFGIDAAHVTDLMGFLDVGWSTGAPPTLGDLERRYDARAGGVWSRDRLLDALRYAFLAGRFDEPFFDAICHPGGRSREVGAVFLRLDRPNELTA